MGEFWNKFSKAVDDFTSELSDALNNNNGYQQNYGQNQQSPQNTTQTAQTTQSSGGFIDSLISSVNASSQNAAFASYVERATQSGEIMAMDNTQKITFLKKAIEYCGADKTPNTTLGRVYPDVVKITEEAQKNSLLPTAHSTCPPGCTAKRDDCENCLKRRLAIYEALYYIDSPEEYKKRFSSSPNPQKQLDLKCSLCGAPVSSSMKVCEYCDTPVRDTVENKTTFLPITSYVPPEQAAYDLIYEVRVEAAEKMIHNKEFMDIMTAMYVAIASQTGLSEFEIRKILNESYAKALNLEKEKMSVGNIHFMAKEYNTDVSTYLRGLFDQNDMFKPYAHYRDDQQFKQQQEQRRRQMEQQRALYEQQKKRNDEFWERRRAMYRPPQYSGGSGGGSGDYHNCAHCVNYANGFCGYKQWKTNASDSCGFFKLR